MDRQSSNYLFRDKISSNSNLFRMNAPSNIFTFIKTLIYCFLQTSTILKDNKICLSYEKKFKNFDIKNDVSIDEIAAFEKCIASDKDYSSNENFIERA